jgi:DNA-binding NtrC family response regulator
MVKNPINILHLDDDPLFLEQMKEALEANPDQFPFQVTSVDNASDYFKLIEERHPFQVIILDVRLEGANVGFLIAEKTRKISGPIPIIMCSDHTQIEQVAACLNHGANDYIFKSTPVRELALRVYGAFLLTRSAPEQQVRDDIVTIGETMLTINRRLPNIIHSAISSVHVLGESGTGKEVVAELFERNLPPHTPFSRVHCGAIAPSLMESELFGHTKGAFTGATSDKPGLIEVADNGWLFLDEVATLSFTTQIALLRVLENGMLRRVGSAKEKRVNVRILSATNESIPELVSRGLFRQDLWQRLCEATIELPPLCDRMGEFDELADYFCSIMKGGPYRLSPDAREILRQYQWKEGNVRELRNCLRAMTELHFEGLLTPLSIPKRFWKLSDQQPASEPVTANSHVSLPEPILVCDSKSLSIGWNGEQRPPFETLSHQMLLEILKSDFQKYGKMSLRTMAALTGISKSTLAIRLKTIAQSGWISKDELAKMVNLTSAEGEK